MNHEHTILWMRIHHMANHTTGKKNLTVGENDVETISAQKEMASKCSNNVKGYGSRDELL